MKESKNDTLADLALHHRKYGATTYTYRAVKVRSVDSENGKVIVTTRNDKTCELIFNDSLSLKEAEEKGLPFPGIQDLK